MNATPINLTDVMEVSEHIDGSDSDTNLDENDTPGYYQPISAVEDTDDENSEPINGNGYEAYGGHENDGVVYHPSLQLSNGHLCASEAVNGMSSLDLNDVAENSKSCNEDEEEEEMTTREASDSEILRAFREDENRRNAPLTPENAMRIREAMRGISFGGATPDWVGGVPDDGWIDQLRRLRQSSQA